MQELTHNRDLMAAAKASLKGKWGQGALLTFVFVLVLTAVGMIPVLGAIAQIVISGPLVLGLYLAFLKAAREEAFTVGTLFDGFQQFARALITYVLTAVFIFLWSLLLLIPGILASLSYSMVYFILLDDESVSANQAIGLSRQLMYGHRWKFFCLNFRFIGWALLAALTFGIAFFWVYPYMFTAHAHFYEDLKRSKAADITPEPAAEPVSA